MSSSRLARSTEGGFAYSNMSSLGPPGLARSYDTTPHLPPAGLGCDPTMTVAPDTTEVTLKPEIYDPAPACPEHIKKWRKDYQPGKSILHPGVMEDTDYQRLEVYGRPEPVGVKVHEIMNVQPKSYLVEKAIEKSEGIYLSHQREPLGKSWQRGHELPQALLHQVGFGMPTPQDISGDAGKALLHPLEQVSDPAEHALYVKSHSNFDPGEQRHRGYTWVDKKGSIDPATFSFGGNVKTNEIAGVAKAINPRLDETLPRDAVVVEKRLEDFRHISKDPLGAVKPVGHGHLTPDDFVFGAPSQRTPEWGVRECIGNYSKEEQAPDPDLGRSVRPGWRNSAPPERMFGVPSIRSDIPAPALKSVADHQNYGNEDNAHHLLYPPRYRDSGVDGNDFLEARTQPELEAIFHAAGADIPKDAIDAIYKKAAAMDAKGLVSVESFRRVLNGF